MLQVSFLAFLDICNEHDTFKFHPMHYSNRKSAIRIFIFVHSKGLKRAPRRTIFCSPHLKRKFQMAIDAKTFLTAQLSVCFQNFSFIKFELAYMVKTTSMLIGTRHIINGKITAEPLRTNFVIPGKGGPIEQKPSIKYLGAHVDNILKWKDHIKAVASKVTRAIAMIRHTKNFIPKHTLKMLYQGLLESHFRFCCSVWETCGITTRCTITDSPYDAPAKALLRQLGAVQ